MRDYVTRVFIDLKRQIIWVYTDNSVRDNRYKDIDDLFNRLTAITESNAKFTIKESPAEIKSSLRNR
jgi:hypothetical protein